jgi:hypothetical protein
MGTHREYKYQLTMTWLISIPVIILFVVYLSLNIQEMAECIWDIVWHGFGNVPGFPIEQI